MKIVFLVRLYEPHIGGVEEHTKKIAAELVKRGNEVTVVTGQYDRKLRLEEKGRGVRILRVPYPTLNSKWGIWRWVVKHKELFEKADVVHAHDVFWWYLPLRFRLPVKKVYTTFHGWEGTFPPRMGAKWSRKVAEILSSKNICVGDYVARWYGTKPDVVTYGATGQKPLPASKSKKILVLGRLSRDNDVGMVIEALKRLKVKATFLGEGELADEAKKVGKVAGFKKNISPYLKSHSLVIASSYLAMLDAMAAGRAVVSVYSNPLKEDYLRLQPTAKWTQICGSVDELVEAIKNPRENVKRARKWAAKQTWSKLADEYMVLWKDKR